MFLSSTCSVPCLAVSPDPQLLGWRTFYSNPRMTFRAGKSCSGVICGNMGWLLWPLRLCVLLAPQWLSIILLHEWLELNGTGSRVLC